MKTEKEKSVRWLCPKCQKKTGSFVGLTIKLIRCSDCGKYWKCLKIFEKKVVEKKVPNYPSPVLEAFHETLRNIQVDRFLGIGDIVDQHGVAR